MAGRNFENIKSGRPVARPSCRRRTDGRIGRCDGAIDRRRRRLQTQARRCVCRSGYQHVQSRADRTERRGRTRPAGRALTPIYRYRCLRHCAPLILSHIRRFLPDVLQSGGRSSNLVKFFLSSEQRYLSFNFGKCSSLFFSAHRAMLAGEKLEILPKHYLVS